MAKKINPQDFSDIPESYQRYLDEIYSITYKKKKGGWVSNKEIADALFISLPTVKQHIYNIYQKIGVKSRMQLNNFIRENIDI